LVLAATPLLVIPAQAGIQWRQNLIVAKEPMGLEATTRFVATG
jgi:hypothetical protein